MLRAMPASKDTWSFLMNSIRKRAPKVPTRNVPKRRPGRSPALRFQYIHIIRPKRAR